MVPASAEARAQPSLKRLANASGKNKTGGRKPPGNAGPPGGGRSVTPAVRPLLSGGTFGRSRIDLQSRREIVTPAPSPIAPSLQGFESLSCRGPRGSFILLFALSWCETIARGAWWVFERVGAPSWLRSCNVAPVICSRSPTPPWNPAVQARPSVFLSPRCYSSLRHLLNALCLDQTRGVV
jgi:hypothetical protein